MKEIGLHIRIDQSPLEAIKKAILLGVPYFQCFFISQKTGAFITITEKERTEFVSLRRNHFQYLFLHGAYWVNLCNTRVMYRTLEHELFLAKRLEFSHIVLHPGSAKRLGCKEKGIDNLTKTLNHIIKKEKDITIVLENTAHGKLTIGSDIHDFVTVLEKIDKPERINFCIDTAHAYSYGYDIATPTGYTDFMSLLTNTIGMDKIALIHLNDTKQQCGSKIDQHCIVGDGILNSKLRYFTHEQKLWHVPMIMELPLVQEQKEKEVLRLVKSWQK